MRWDGFPALGVSSPHLKVWWGMKNLLLPYLKKLCILYFCFTKKLLFNKERLQSIKGEFIFKFRSRNKRFGMASCPKSLYWLMCGLFFPLDKKENGKKPWKSTRKPLVKSFSKLYRKIRKQIYRGWKLLTFGFEEQSLKFRLWWSSFFFRFLTRRRVMRDPREFFLSIILARRPIGRKQLLKRAKKKLKFASRMN